MPVLEVGTGVGYLKFALAVCWRFNGRGSAGDDERGSKAGRSDGAGRFVPVVVVEVEERAKADVEADGNATSLPTAAAAAARGGDESIIIRYC